MYSCEVPSSVSKGAYVIQAYIERNEELIILERGDASHLIDKLPLWVIGTSIRALSLPLVSNNMQLLNLQNDLYQVSRRRIFNVRLSTSTGENPSLGLFNLDGSFYRDIQKNREGIIYVAEIPVDVVEGNYILAPYSLVNG